MVRLSIFETKRVIRPVVFSVVKELVLFYVQSDLPFGTTSRSACIFSLNVVSERLRLLTEGYGFYRNPTGLPVGISELLVHFLTISQDLP